MFPQTLKFYISRQICKVLSVIIWVQLAAISIFSAHRPRIFGQFSAPLRRSNNFSGRAQTFNGRNCILVCQFANLKTFFVRSSFNFQRKYLPGNILTITQNLFHLDQCFSRVWRNHRLKFSEEKKSWRCNETKSVKPGGKSVDMASLTGN